MIHRMISQKVVDGLRQNQVDELDRLQEQADQILVQVRMQIRPIGAIQKVNCSAWCGVVSLVSGYALTEASDLTMKDTFSATLESVVDQCPRRDTLLNLGDFNTDWN